MLKFSTVLSLFLLKLSNFFRVLKLVFVCNFFEVMVPHKHWHRVREIFVISLTLFERKSHITKRHCL